MTTPRLNLPRVRRRKVDALPAELIDPDTLEQTYRVLNDWGRHIVSEIETIDGGSP